MKFLLLSILFCSIVSASCSKNNDTDKKTYDYFSTHLRSDMNYSAIVNLFGDPDDDIGSGIHIYVYKLSDGTEIWIGYTDRIHYARHLGPNRQVLHVII